MTDTKKLLTKDLVEVLSLNTRAGLTSKASIDLVRELFDVLNTQIEGVSEGRITIQGFGVFVIRLVETADKTKVRRIVFKPTQRS